MSLKWSGTRVNGHLGFVLGDDLAIVWPSNEKKTGWWISIRGADVFWYNGTAAAAKRHARNILKELRDSLKGV